jgi:hypothetical protein
MDRFTRRLTVDIAESMSRRDLVSRSLRALVGGGAVLAAVLGAPRAAFATFCIPGAQHTCTDWSLWCHDDTDVNRPCSGAGYSMCASGDCEGGGTSNCKSTGSYPTSVCYYDCCCQATQARCRVCQSSMGQKCICQGPVPPNSCS